MKMFAQGPCYLVCCNRKRADLPHLQLHLKTVQLYAEAVYVVLLFGAILQFDCTGQEFVEGNIKCSLLSILSVHTKLYTTQICKFTFDSGFDMCQAMVLAEGLSTHGC